MIGPHFHGFFFSITLPVLQPSDHPFINPLPLWLRRTMWAGADSPVHAILGVVQPIPGPRFLENVTGALERKEILEGRDDEPRFRREQLDVVCFVETGRKEVRNALLGI